MSLSDKGEMDQSQPLSQRLICHVCGVCGKEFRDPYALRRHQQQHNVCGCKEPSCAECAMIIVRPRKTIDERFRCDVCHK